MIYYTHQFVLLISVDSSAGLFTDKLDIFEHSSPRVISESEISGPSCFSDKWPVVVLCSVSISSIRQRVCSVA